MVRYSVKKNKRYLDDNRIEIDKKCGNTGAEEVVVTKIILPLIV